MQYFVNTPEEYLKQIPDDRKEVISKLRKVISDNLPEGFEETISYGMIGYVVPHTIYPKGYHCDPKLPLPFISIASQKNFFAFYHMGLYAKKELLDWFIAEYEKRAVSKPDMSKSCLRFKKPEKIPYDLLSELVAKMNCNEWISVYEENLVKKK
jgi:uncharacterized protein YdhG (YjbR/CyaY superfamily)